MYIAIDGDDTGRRLESFLLRDDHEGAATFSLAVADALDSLRERFETKGARIVFCAGDSLLAEAGNAIVDQLPPPASGPVSWSIGIGKTPSHAVLALKLAKGLGRNRVSYFPEEV